MISSTTTFSVSRDHRCPACGRVVLTPFEQGVEGRYHPECVKLPVAPLIGDWPPRVDMPNFPNFPHCPYPHYPNVPWSHLNSCL